MTRPPSTRSRALQATLAVWYVVPLVPLALWSVATRWSYPAPLPQQWGLGAAADRGALVAATGASVALGLLTVALAVPAGASAALAVRALPPRLLRVAQVALLSPVAVPPLALALGATPVLLRLRVPSLAGVALLLAGLALPYTFLAVRGALQEYDWSVEEQARLLGATTSVVVRAVRTPALRRPLALAAFLAFLIASSDYIVTVVVGGGTVVTLPLLVAGAASGTGNEHVVAVVSMLAALPPLLLALALLRPTMIHSPARADTRVVEPALVP
ncbi:MAG: ABC transporter permease subunit [Frankiales bacterium]|nr:ABC transporter permease subunit [Frankiales bacterium]